MAYKKTIYERKKMPNGKWQFVPIGYYHLWPSGMAVIHDKLYKKVNRS